MSLPRDPEELVQWLEGVQDSLGEDGLEAVGEALGVDVGDLWTLAESVEKGHPDEGATMFFQAFLAGALWARG